MSAAKARRLMDASKPGEMRIPDAGILGTEFDKLSRSMMASLERMTSVESARCSQALLNLLVNHYDTAEVQSLPEDAQALLSGLVTFGAEVGGAAVTAEGMDAFFIEHWWDMIVATLPTTVHGASRSAAPSSMPTSRVTATETTTSMAPVDGTEETVELAGHGECGTGSGMWVLPATRESPIELNDSLPVIHDEAQATQVVEQHDNGIVAQTEDTRVGEIWPQCLDMRRAMEDECQRFRAAQLQEWEDEVLREAMHQGPLPGVGIVLRGSVVGGTGIHGTSQTMSFRLCRGETLALRMEVESQATCPPPPTCAASVDAQGSDAGVREQGLKGSERDLA